ncbi:hypothetical protein BDY24DRAFT_1727 [Mrakia frigida]|uniref:uncharacterized protein n=1 Tax=Mrakia frigida TaxID=29902 RepID=UPI003FCBF62A
MPADRPSHQLNPSFPFDQRRGSSLSASSSSSSPSQHPSSVPSPCSTLESDYPETPPSFPQRIPIHGFSNQQQQQQQHHFPRPLTTSSFFPGEAQGQQHQQHQQLGGSNRVGGDGFSRPRELSVGYDPGGGGGERKVFEGGGGGQGRYSASPGFSPQDLVIYGPSVEYGFKSPLPLPLPLPLSSFTSSRAPATALVQPYFHSPVSPAPPFYPNYQGPPVFEDPERPTQDEIEMWESESEGGQPPAPDRTLQMPPPVVYRSTASTDCKRCRSHAVDCEWPGDEGVGACSNCFFSYSLCEAWTPPQQNQPSDNFSLSSLTQQLPNDGERTPTQSPRPLPSQSSSQSPSTSASHFKLPLSSNEPTRPSPQIPISFLLTQPSSASSSSSSQPGRRSSSSPPAASSSSSSSKKKQSDLVEGEMTELFGRVVQLQADANSSLGQVVEKLRSPPAGGSKLMEEKELIPEGRQETEVDRPESGGSGSVSGSMEGLVDRRQS